MSEFGLADLATILIGLAIVGMAIFLGMLTIYSWPMLAQLGRAISRRYFDIAWPHLIDRIADDAMSSYDAVPDVDQKWPERRSYAVDRLSDQPGTVGGNEVLAWLERCSDDAVLDILARVKMIDGSDRYADSRIAKFIGGRIEDRIVQVRAVRQKSQEPPEPARVILARTRGADERLIALDDSA